MSSPGTYSRCSANSTENPWYGLGCIPATYPSTTILAWRSSPSRLASVRGFKYFCKFSTLIRLVAVDGDRLDQPTHDVVGLQALGLGVEVGHDPVPEDRAGDRPDVVGRHVVPAVQD